MNREDNTHASQDDNNEEEGEIMTNRWDRGDGGRAERSRWRSGRSRGAILFNHCSTASPP
eukprot:7696089-Pyramimonas_sp.AAC.1